MNNYRNYSENKLFRYIREKVFKISKPSSLPWGQWDIWRDKVKVENPIGWFFTETLPDWLEYPSEWFIDPISNLFYKLRNRFVSKTHIMRTGLPAGTYHDVGTKMLHGLFTELVNFIEIEKAFMSYRFSDDFDKNVPWWRRNWVFRWAEWRNIKAGIEHLKWEMSLDDTSISQARSATEQMILYTWWKEIRPARIDEYEITGYHKFIIAMDSKYGDQWHFDSLGSGSGSLTADEKLEHHRLLDEVNKLEEQRHEEDTEMLIRLVKERQSLWT